MNAPNPYESPSTVSDDPATQPRQRLFRPLEIFMCCWLAILFAAALGHRCQLPRIDNVRQEDVYAYCHSPLIAVEIIGILGAVGIVPLALGRSLYLAVHARFACSAFNLLICLLAFGSVGVAFLVDAPMLIYAT